MQKNLPYSFSPSIKMIALSCCILYFTACGKEYEETVEKDYKLSLEVNDNIMESSFAQFIERYNNEIGFKALELVSPGADANSQILVTVGLKIRDDKIGWGQWIKTIDTPNENQLFQKQDAVKLVRYSMRVEFDDTYVRQRIRANSSDVEKKEVYRLFAHEIGHGFTLDHDTNPTSVMYEKVLSNDADFKLYYKKVRDFFGIASE